MGAVQQLSAAARHSRSQIVPGGQIMSISASFDRSYFEERLDRNRRLAARSRNPQIRAIHLEYVRLYSQLLEQAAPAPA